MQASFRQNEACILSIAAWSGIARINVKVDNKHCVALLDTGAGANFISERLVSKYRGRFNKNRSRIEQAISGTSIKSSGFCTLEIKLEGRAFMTEFIVMPELREDMILGCPWLGQNGAILDLERRCLYIGETPRLTIHWRGQTSVATSDEILLDVKASQLPSENCESILKVLRQYAEVFAESQQQSITKSVTHRIILTKDEPFRLKPYRYSDTRLAIIREEVAKMLSSGVIRESNSSYCSPIVIVTKKSGEPRFCIDYRKLNTITATESANLPPINDVIRNMGGAKVFSTLDLKSGYWQIPVEESCKRYTAFSTPDGSQYEFNVMPFGLKNAPASFQKTMNSVLAGYTGRFCGVYIDDVVIYSKNLQEHLQHLGLVLERFKIHGFRCNLPKCFFGKDNVEYLGHIITPDNTEAHPKHLEALKNYPTPTSVKQLRGFLGVAGWLREFIERFSEKAAPLTDLTTNKKRFVWTPEANDAFELLKREASRPMILARPIPNKKFIIQTDASKIGMAAVLYQEGEDGTRRIVSHASAKFKGAEKLYHANESECYAAVWAIKKYRPFLESGKFILRTDSQCLTWLDRFKDSKTKFLRWALLLQEFDFDIEHVTGKSNHLPDFLSRNPEDAPDAEEDLDEAVERLAVPQRDCKENSNPSPLINQLENAFVLIEERQRRDNDIRVLKARWRRLGNEGPRTQAEEDFFGGYYVDEERDLLYKIDLGGRRRLVVPTDATQDVIYLFHDAPEASHPGIKETQRVIKQNYFWNNLDREVQSYVQHCLVCATVKASARQPGVPLRPHSPRRPWQMVSLDILGPYAISRQGNRYIIIAVDCFSKWVEMQPIPDMTTRHILRFLEREIFARWGCPEVLITDNALQFMGNAFERMLELNHVQNYFSPVYHQQANPVERRVQEVKKILRSLLINKRESEWEKHIHTVLYCLRNRKNRAIDQTPAELLLGYTPPRPGAWVLPEYSHPIAVPRNERVARAQRRQIVFERNLFPEPRQAPIQYQPGDMVLVRNFNKSNFAQTWLGPFPIVRREGDNVYSIDRNGSERRIHLKDIRKAPPRRRRSDVEEESDDGAPELPETQDEPQAAPELANEISTQQAVEQPVDIVEHESTTDTNSSDDEADQGPVLVTTKAIVHSSADGPEDLGIVRNESVDVTPAPTTSSCQDAVTVPRRRRRVRIVRVGQLEAIFEKRRKIKF